jgi:hypothetical protein
MRQIQIGLKKEQKKHSKSQKKLVQVELITVSLQPNLKKRSFYFLRQFKMIFI